MKRIRTISIHVDKIAGNIFDAIVNLGSMYRNYIERIEKIKKSRWDVLPPF